MAVGGPSVVESGVGAGVCEGKSTGVRPPALGCDAGAAADDVAEGWLDELAEGFGEDVAGVDFRRLSAALPAWERSAAGSGE